MHDRLSPVVSETWQEASDIGKVLHQKGLSAVREKSGNILFAPEGLIGGFFRR